MNYELLKATVYLLVGVAILLIGMRMMSSGFKKSIGKKIRDFFKRTQDKAVLNMGIGTVVTAAIQSSDATNAMVVGFINTGAMTIYQGLCIMLGAYIGTTVTGVIASFSSLSISIYFLLFTVIGVIMMFFNKEIIKNIGEILAGLGLLFFGLAIMKDSFKNADITNFTKMLFSSINFGPLLFLVGLVVTAIMDSSSAVTSIVIAMVGSGAIELSSGLFIVLGATLGTVVTTLLVAIGGHVNGKRAAWIAFSLRALTSVVMVIILTLFRTPITNVMTAFASRTSGELAVAIFTVIYNIVFMPLLLPLLKPAINLFSKLIKEKETASAMDGVIKYIDNKMLAFPHVATGQVEKELLHMYTLALENYERSIQMILTKDFEAESKLLAVEEQIDYLNERITAFLIELSSRVQPSEERKAGSYFHVVNDIERIADHAINISVIARELADKDLAFSELAKAEINSLNAVVMEMFTLTRTIFETRDAKLLKTLHELEEKADAYKTLFFNNHYDRIKNKSCVFELSPFYSTFLGDLERVSDHLNNIGFSIVNPTGVDQFIKA
ncbi:MAG: Na+/Pi-cotransporter [Tenericutes bacterium ADurb.Bin087]|nr:MAG: Na+/Pi-cotransporter [Tenericutes bacterium ADurb.Bin087]